MTNSFLALYSYFLYYPHFDLECNSTRMYIETKKEDCMDLFYQIW